MDIFNEETTYIKSLFGTKKKAVEMTANIVIQRTGDPV
jgi:hypothetical protein